MRKIKLEHIAGCKVPARHAVVYCDRCKTASKKMYTLKATDEDLCEHCLVLGIVNGGLATPLMI